MTPDVTWQQVAYSLVISIPAIIAAFGAVFYGKKNAASLVTKNGKTVGELVDDVHETVSAGKTGT